MVVPYVMSRRLTVSRLEKIPREARQPDQFPPCRFTILGYITISTSLASYAHQFDQQTEGIARIMPGRSERQAIMVLAIIVLTLLYFQSSLEAGQIQRLSGFTNDYQASGEAFFDHNDTDKDGIPDSLDNCPCIQNHNQQDFDSDGIGDLCDFKPADGDSTLNYTCGSYTYSSTIDGPSEAFATEFSAPYECQVIRAKVFLWDLVAGDTIGDVQLSIHTVSNSLPVEPPLHSIVIEAATIDSISTGLGLQSNFLLLNFKLDTFEIYFSANEDWMFTVSPVIGHSLAFLFDADNCEHSRLNTLQLTAENWIPLDRNLYMLCDIIDRCSGLPGTDTDGDGSPDSCDVCPNDSLNDIDRDGICGDIDNCPFINNPGQEDTDGDTFADSCDNCLNNFNIQQTDSDGDGVGDSCDVCPGFNDLADSDGDGVPDSCDICPGFSDNLDADGDSHPDNCDNCPQLSNHSQVDSDGDGVGDSCDKCVGFNDNNDFDNDGLPDACDPCPINPASPCCCSQPGDADDGGDVNIGDATFIISYIFQNGDTPPCLDQADANGSNDISVSDAIYIVRRVFQNGALPRCGTTGS